MTTPKTEYDTEIEELTKQGEAITEKLQGLITLRAISLCPFHIGDILTDEKGRTARVTGIFSHGWYRCPYSLAVVMILKDGTDGRGKPKFHAYDGWHNDYYKVGDVK